MKFGELKSIGHNIADSLASGVGLMIGVYDMDVFGEAARSPEGYILVDFITGASSGSKTTASLAKAISLYAQALDELCQRHGVRAGAFRELKARYSRDVYGGRFVVMVADQMDAVRRMNIAVPLADVSWNATSWVEFVRSGIESRAKLTVHRQHREHV